MSAPADRPPRRDAVQRLVSAYANLVVVMRDAVHRLTTKQALRSAPVRSAMQGVFEEALEREWLLTGLARLPRGPDDAARRLSAVAALTLVLTRQLLLSPADAVELCTAALFHDLATLPGETAQVAQRMRALARCAADVLTDEVLHQATVAVEWTLGPAHANPSARFISVPSIFELLTQPAPGRPAVATDDAMRLLLQMGDQRLDDTMVHLFVRHFGFFPPGTAVLLSDGGQAIVVRPPPEDAPLDQPVVRRYEAGFAMTETDLRGEPGLAISGCVAPQVNPLRAWLE